MARDVFSHLMEDDLDPPGDLPTWESHGAWALLVTPKGIAILVTPPGEEGYGIVRFPDGAAVTIPPGAAKELYERAESMLTEGPPVWDRLDRDYLDPEKVDAPKAPPTPEVQDTTVREPPKRRGQKTAFPWDFKK